MGEIIQPNVQSNGDWKDRCVTPFDCLSNNQWNVGGANPKPSDFANGNDKVKNTWVMSISPSNAPDHQCECEVHSTKRSSHREHMRRITAAALPRSSQSLRMAKQRASMAKGKTIKNG